jgi:hypothetical protein
VKSWCGSWIGLRERFNGKESIYRMVVLYEMVVLIYRIVAMFMD